MVKHNRINPLLCAALGLALSYYGFEPLRALAEGWAFVLLMVFFFLFIVLSGLRVMAQIPPAMAGNAVYSHLFRRIHIYLTAFSAGLALGFVSGRIQPVRLGMDEGEIEGLYGTVLDDPRTFEDGRGMARLEITRSAAQGGAITSARGEIPVFFPQGALSGLKQFGRGSEIYMEGSLFTESGREPVFYTRSLYILKAAPPLEQLRTGIRTAVIEKFKPRAWPGEAVIGKFFPLKDWTGLALALVLGVRDNLDIAIGGSFRDAGCSHVLALSGMHLAIISSLIAFFLKKPLGIKAASLLGALIIVCYVFLVGVQPSLLRSAIMYLLGTLAVWGFIKKDVSCLLCLSFIIQIVSQPESGRTISFILSYLALAGILYLGEPINDILGGLPRFLSGGISASLGAFIATAAAVSLFFGILRPIGIVVGLAVVPLATVFMIGSLAYLAISFCPPLAGILGTALSLFYTIMERLTGFAARVPGLKVPEAVPVLLISLALGAFLLYFSYRDRKKRYMLAPFR